MNEVTSTDVIIGVDTHKEVHAAVPSAGSALIWAA